MVSPRTRKEQNVVKDKERTFKRSLEELSLLCERLSQDGQLKVFKRLLLKNAVSSSEKDTVVGLCCFILVL